MQNVECRRPKYRWEDNTKQDICQMKNKNWIACVQDRGKWKEVVEKAKTFNQEVQRLEEEEGVQVSSCSHCVYLRSEILGSLYGFYSIHRSVFSKMQGLYIYVYFYECCSLFYYCVHAVRDQTAQTTVAPFISHSINFKDFMYLYIHTFHHISYCNNFLLIIYKLM